MRTLTIVLAILVILLAVFLIVRGNSNSTNNPPATNQQQNQNEEFSTPPQNENSVLMANSSFNPRSITINKSEAVTFINNDNIAHTVTANDGFFDSGNLTPNQEFSFTFNQAGTYNYNCSIHPNMTGTVIVK